MVSLLRCRKLSIIGRHTVRASPKPQMAPTRRMCAPTAMSRKRTAMNVRQPGISRRSIAVAAALVGMVSLAIGAHAALNKRTLDASKAIATGQSADAAKRAARIALVIGNGHYPDASA